jgi:hypothetical protein
MAWLAHERAIANWNAVIRERFAAKLTAAVRLSTRALLDMRQVKFPKEALVCQALGLIGRVVAPELFE